MNNQENTRLIAELMGYEVIDYQHNKFNPIYNGNKNAKTVGQQKELWQGLDLQFTGRFVSNVNYPFSDKWEYLMPVIAEIERNGYVVKIAGISCQIYKQLEEHNPIVSWVCGEPSKKICMVYNSVIDFLKHQKTTL